MSIEICPGCFAFSANPSSFNFCSGIPDIRPNALIGEDVAFVCRPSLSHRWSIQRFLRQGSGRILTEKEQEFQKIIHEIRYMNFCSLVRTHPDYVDQHRIFSHAKDPRLELAEQQMYLEQKRSAERLLVQEITHLSCEYDQALWSQDDRSILSCDWILSQKSMQRQNLSREIARHIQKIDQIQRKILFSSFWERYQSELQNPSTPMSTHTEEQKEEPEADTAESSSVSSFVPTPFQRKNLTLDLTLI